MLITTPAPTHSPGPGRFILVRMVGANGSEWLWGAVWAEAGAVRSYAVRSRSLTGLPVRVVRVVIGKDLERLSVPDH